MRYWLVKTEPDQFALADFHSAVDKTTVWDGIRNYAARNYLREMQIGDRVFIYYSSCKVPRIVGSAVVVAEHFVDPQQFNPESPYFDAKSKPEAPKWSAVKLQLADEFSQACTLSEIKKRPELADMLLLKQSRLSVSPVTKSQWQVIMSQVGMVS